ncbi:Dicarboxylic amino acid permease [Venturia inaequalis]|nr:Dicarboxylic amino acid permease [Venturia inaequalis]
MRPSSPPVLASETIPIYELGDIEGKLVEAGRTG